MAGRQSPMKSFLIDIISPDFSDVRDRDGHLVCPSVQHSNQDYAVCPYRDSRYQHPNPMNQSSLRIVQEHYPFVMETLTKIAAAFKLEHAVTKLGPLDVWRIWIMFYSLPILSFAVQRERASSTLSQPLSVIYKVSIGFVDVLSNLIMNTAEADASNVLSDEEQFFDYLDRRGLLISDREVCAGSSGMIKVLMQLICRAKPEPVASFHGISLRSCLAFAEVAFNAMIGSYHAAELMKGQARSPGLTTQGGPIMRPRVSFNKLHSDSILGSCYQHFVKRVIESGLAKGVLNPLQDLTDDMNFHLTEMAAELLEVNLDRLSLEDYISALRLETCGAATESQLFT
jgi:hypothetical protein